MQAYPRVSLWVGWRLLFVLVPLGGAMGVFAQTPEQVRLVNREYAIKAAFLYQFLSYIEWPHEAGRQVETPFVVGVFQSDPFGGALQKLAENRKVAGRPFTVKLLKSPRDARGCHIVFVHKNVPDEAEETLHAALARTPVLTVGEDDQFMDEGGVVQFYLEGNKVRFAFNLNEVQERELKVSSKLLSLAKIVGSGESTGAVGQFAQ